MDSIAFGIFLLLHGIVHLLYFGHSARYFELKEGMLWPDGSWAFTNLFGEGTTRTLASILLVVAAIIFVLAGLSVFIKVEWWQAAVTIAAVFSTVIYLLLWDGGMQNLDGKGLVGILINLTILLLVQVFHWPRW